MELSVIVARGRDEVAAFPLGRNVHDVGVLVETGVAASVSLDVAAEAVSIGTSLAVAMDLTGTLTVELFLMPDDSLVVNELAPRVHNSGTGRSRAPRPPSSSSTSERSAGWGSDPRPRTVRPPWSTC